MKLKEGLISVGSKRVEEPDPLDPEIIKRFDNHFKYDEIDDDYYATEDSDAPHFRRILHWYRDHFGSSPTGASILLPIGALRALRRLTAFSDGRCIVISGDKGNNNPEQFRGLMDPHIAVHGSFSVMVNYHAIGMYFTSRGGFALHNPQEETSLKVSAFVLTGARRPRAQPRARRRGRRRRRRRGGRGRRLGRLDGRRDRRAGAARAAVPALRGRSTRRCSASGRATSS